MVQFNYKTEKGFTQWSENIPTNKNYYVAAYATGYSILHYAKAVDGIVTAKLGYGIVAQHDRVNAYFTSSSYGRPIAYYWKP